MRRIILLLVALACLLATTGCAPRYVVGTTQGLAAPAASYLRRYTIARPVGVAAGDLQYRSYSDQVAAVLATGGFVRDESPIKGVTQLMIVIDAKLGAPESRSSTSVLPVFGQTGIGSSTTTGMLSPGGFYTETTSYAPTYGVVDAVPITKTWTECNRALQIRAFDMSTFWGAKNPKLTPTWTASVQSRGNTCNLPAIFPYLLKLVTPAIATNLNPRTLQTPME